MLMGNVVRPTGVNSEEGKKIVPKALSKGGG